MKQFNDSRYVAAPQSNSPKTADSDHLRHGLALLAAFVLVVLTAATCFADVPGYLKAKMGNLKGQVEVDGLTMPADGVLVSFFNSAEGYPPTEGSLQRVPDMVSRSDKDGRFDVRLVPGKYYMGIMVRALDHGAGPPKPGEKYYFVRDEQGKLRALEVITKQDNEVGAVKGQEPGAFKEFADFFTVEGTVFGEDGKPEAGAVVLVKTSIDMPRPLYITHPTDKDGKYTMKLPTGREYFLVVRQSIQGRPVPGSQIGAYGKSAPAQLAGKDGIGAPVGVSGKGGEGTALAVKGKTGEVVKGVDINLFKIPDPEENRKKFLKERRGTMTDEQKKPEKKKDR